MCDGAEGTIRAVWLGNVPGSGRRCARTLDALHAYRDTIAQWELRSGPLHLGGVPVGPGAVVISFGLLRQAAAPRTCRGLKHVWRLAGAR